jgi:lysophospholipid acyltransferase (LPLAT)-like uncharacterized protein
MRLPRSVKGRARFVRIASFAIAWLLRGLGATWRIRTQGQSPFETGEPAIASIWHQSLLVAAYLMRGQPIAVPVSLSRDGDLTAAVLERLGFPSPPRGSSSRGASGLLRQMIRSRRDGLSVGVLPDGPRGPARVAKPGVLAVARATGTPIRPVGMAARPALRFGSWDRTFLPLPFARVRVAYGPPILVPKNTREEALEDLRRHLEEELDRLTDGLERELGLPPDPSGATSGRGA